jgi:hypothetical protein
LWRLVSEYLLSPHFRPFIETKKPPQKGGFLPRAEVTHTLTSKRQTFSGKQTAGVVKQCFNVSLN